MITVPSRTAANPGCPVTRHLAGDVDCGRQKETVMDDLREQDRGEPRGYWRQPVTRYDWLRCGSIAVLLLVIAWRTAR
jgi:hypothetical protein